MSRTCPSIPPPRRAPSAPSPAGRPSHTASRRRRRPRALSASLGRPTGRLRDGSGASTASPPRSARLAPPRASAARPRRRGRGALSRRRARVRGASGGSAGEGGSGGGGGGGGEGGASVAREPITRSFMRRRCSMRGRAAWQTAPRKSDTRSIRMEEPVWNVGAMLLPATLAVRSSCETMPSTAAVAAAAATPTACDMYFAQEDGMSRREEGFRSLALFFC